MRRHLLFFCSLVLLILISNQGLPAEESPRSEQQKTTTSSSTDPRPILTQWSEASRILPPLTRSTKLDDFKKGNQKYFSGHELTLISEFQQPVTTQKLLSDYDWQVIKQTKSNFVLQGQPRDVLTRRFCRPFQLQINRQSMLPESLTYLSGPAKEKQGFASIDLTAFTVTHAQSEKKTSPQSQTVLPTVAKAVFSQVESLQKPASEMSPITRVSFSTSKADYENQAELRNVENMVARWIAESKRIRSVKLGPITVLKPDKSERRYRPRNETPPPKNLFGTAISSINDVFRFWIIDVDPQRFVIDSFATELPKDDKEQSAPRLVTVKIKPDPDYSQPNWDSVEMVFNSAQPLPVRIDIRYGDYVQEILLSGIQVEYEE